MTPKLKKSALILSAIFAFTFVSLANENEIVEQVQDDDVIFIVVEKMPEFPGGQLAMMRFISENMRFPPPFPACGFTGGRVILQFIVEKTGEISNIEVVRGVDTSLDREAIRIVESMPNWIPGEQRGEKVRVKFILPVIFRLQ